MPTLAGVSMLASEKVKFWQMLVSNYLMNVTLIVFGISHFDFILGPERCTLFPKVKMKKTQINKLVI